MIQMKVNKFTILMMALLFAWTANAQKPSLGQMMGERVPLYCGSTGNSTADSTRLPILFQARLSGLTPGARYKIFARFISAADTGSTTTTGTGIPIVIRNGSWFAISNPDLNTSGAHDTITLGLGQGEYSGWFGAMYTNDSRFSPGNYIYPMVVLEEVGSGSPIVMKFYINDSIKVLGFSQANNSNSGTAVFGSSFAPAKSIISLYDDVNGLTNRPINITYAENDGISNSNMSWWYNNKINGTAGAWASIIPNDLSNGIQRIDSRDFTFDTVIYANTEPDAVWGSDSTADRRGGAINPVLIKSDYAPLLKPEFQFMVNTVNVNESNTIVKAVVRRRYGNADSSKISANVVAGTATSGVDYNLLTTSQIVFKPYGEAFDTVRVQILDDQISEPIENVAIRLTGSVNGRVGFQTTHSINIVDNDIPKAVFDKKSVTVKENDGILKVKLRMTNGATTPTNVKIAVKSKTDSTHIPMDFKMGSNNIDTTVQFAGGKAIDSLEFNIYLQNDGRSEDRSDTVVLVIRSLTAPGIAGIDSLLTLIIQDDDAPSIFKFEKDKLTVNENVGSIKLRIDRKLGNIFQSDIILSNDASSKNAQAGSDFTFSPQLLSFDTSDPDSFVITIPIIDDNLSEPREDAVFVIRPSFNATIARPDTFRVTIIDNDLPEYSVLKVTTLKTPNMTLDSINVHCALRGIVYGVNMGPVGSTAGTTFTLRDKTGGIQVFQNNSAKGYTVTEGDSVLVQGRVTQTNGMAQFSQLDTIFKLGSGKTLKSPTVVTSLNESTESDLVKFNLVKLANPSKWPTAAMAPNTTVSLTVLTSNDSFTMVIDSETDIDGKAAPAGFFNLVGIGGQIDASSPYTSGYVIYPRRFNDITNLTVPVFSFTTTSSTSVEKRPMTEPFTLQCANITSSLQITAAIKGGTAARGVDYQSNAFRLFILTPTAPSVVIQSQLNDDAIPELEETIIWVIRDNPWGTLIGPDSVHTIALVDDETVSIDGLGYSGSVKMYPNPAINEVRISSLEAVISTVEIVDLSGKVVMTFNDIDSLNASLNIEGLSKGMYHVNIVTFNGTARKILSVQ